jgi:hypothetical protein
MSFFGVQKVSTFCVKAVVSLSEQTSEICKEIPSKDLLKQMNAGGK